MGQDDLHFFFTLQPLLVPFWQNQGINLHLHHLHQVNRRGPLVVAQPDVCFKSKRIWKVGWGFPQLKIWSNSIWYMFVAVWYVFFGVCFMMFIRFFGKENKLFRRPWHHCCAKKKKIQAPPERKPSRSPRKKSRWLPLGLWGLDEGPAWCMAYLILVSSISS